jgi:hypothetical protein
MEQISKLEQISKREQLSDWNNFEIGTNYKLERISNLINFELNKIKIEQKFESSFFYFKQISKL